MPLSDYLLHVSFRRYAPLSLKVVKKSKNLTVFWPRIFWEGRPRLFYCRLPAQCTVHRWAKLGWVLFADLRVRMSGQPNDVMSLNKSAHNCTVELCRRRHSTRQSHGLFALPKHLFILDSTACRQSASNLKSEILSVSDTQRI